MHDVTGVWRLASASVRCWLGLGLEGSNLSLCVLGLWPVLTKSSLTAVFLGPVDRPANKRYACVRLFFKCSLVSGGGPAPTCNKPILL